MNLPPNERWDRLHQVHQTGMVVFNGWDEVFAAGMFMGADGGIGTFYNLVPELFLKAASGNCFWARPDEPAPLCGDSNCLPWFAFF